MSYMFEVYYKSPPDSHREKKITEAVTPLGGTLTYREGTEERDAPAVILTYEFEEWDSARNAATSLRRLGEHVEGPVNYGP